MGKLWKIIRHEYTRHVLRKRFIIALLSVPIWIAIAVGASVLSIVLQVNPEPVGYVDPGGFLDEINLDQVDREDISFVDFLQFASEEEARSALEEKDIQAYYVIPVEYPGTVPVKQVFIEEPSGMINEGFADILRAGLLRTVDPVTANRVSEGAQVSIQALEEDRQMGTEDWFKVAAPIIAGIFLMVAVFTSGGYLMQAIVDEKENRTMEVLATSLSPMQIMGGKIIALISVGMTQVIVWGMFPILVIILARAYVPFLQGIELDWKLLGLVVITAFPTFILISALMAAIGATVTEAREGQQVSTLVTLPVMSPVMLISPIMANPGGALAVSMSLFPLTAALTILLRTAFATVPTWQIVMGVVLLLISAVGSLWLAGRVFRLGMLRYGKRLGWKEIFQGHQTRRRAGE